MTRGILCACTLAGVGVLSFAAGAERLRTPETSRHFKRHVDPETGVVSWMMKPKSFAWNQQSIYFTAKSMTDDGRFLVFDCSDNEFRKDANGKPAPVRKRKAVVDFLKDEIIALPETTGSIPYLDPEEDRLFYTSPQGVWRHDLLADPAKRTLVCPWPREFLDLSKKFGAKRGHLATSPSGTRRAKRGSGPRRKTRRGTGSTS